MGWLTFIIVEWVVPRLSISSQVRYARWMKEAHPEIYGYFRSRSVLANVGLSNKEHAEVLGRSLTGSTVVGVGVDTEGFLVIEFSTMVLRLRKFKLELMELDSIKERPTPIGRSIQ